MNEHKDLSIEPTNPFAPSGRLLVAVILVDAIFSVLPSANILVVDDNSPDGTGR